MKAPSVIAIFLVALAFRIVHVWLLRRSPFFDVLLGDAHGYDEWARRLAGGEWIGRDVFYQAPLYPYFLGVIYAIVGHSLTAVRLVQAVVGSLSCALVAVAGRRFFTPAAGIVAGFAMAIYAPAIFFDGLLQKSVLDVFFVSLGLWLVSRLIDEPDHRGRWLALGAAMGGLSLTRENALVFIVVILGWCVFIAPVRLQPDTTTVTKKKARAALPVVVSGFSRTERLGFAAAFVVGLAIVLLPVAVRNYAVSGGFYITTSQAGPNFYIGNNPKADGSYMSLRYGRGAPEFERQDATELAEHALGRSLTPGEVSSYWTDKAFAYITSQPASWLKLVARKFALLWNTTEMLDTESQESYAEWSWPLRLTGWFSTFGVLVPLALIGAILAWPDRRRIGILYVMVAAYAASVVLFYVFARYRLPLVPFLMLFAGNAIVFGASLAIAYRAGKPLPALPFGRSAFPAISALIVVALVVAFTNWPMLSGTLMMAITETNLATALQAGGRPAEAIEHFRRAIALEPDYAPAYNNLGVVQRATGDVSSAVDSYQRALAITGDYPDAHYNLANALLEQRKPHEAAEHFQIALRSIPDSAGASNNLGIALANEGKGEDAVRAFRAAVAADPTSAKAHRNLADALSAARQADESIAEYRRAIELDPRDAGAHYNFGSVLLEAQRLDEAIAEFRATLQLTPASPEAHNNLGIALGSKGNLDGAIDEFRKALSLQPGFPDAQRNLEMTFGARDQMRGGRR